MTEQERQERLKMDYLSNREHYQGLFYNDDQEEKKHERVD